MLTSVTDCNNDCNLSPLPITDKDDTMFSTETITFVKEAADWLHMLFPKIK